MEKMKYRPNDAQLLAKDRWRERCAETKQFTPLRDRCIFCPIGYKNLERILFVPAESLDESSKRA